MRNKGLPYLVVLSIILILSNLSYALTGYKTGLPIDQYYLYSATWDGNQWKVSTTLMKVIRDPSYGLNVKAEKPLVITYGNALPPAPNQTKGWYLSGSGWYASWLNDVLQKNLPGILKSQNDTSSRVVADLAIRTSDGKEVHYIATYDGNNGYRSYGFQTSAPNYATFVYYSKTLDSEFPPPPPGTQLVQNLQAQSNLGKYSYVIFKPNGEIMKQDTVDVNGRYDSTDDTGLNRFINEVVLPTMRYYDVGLSIVRYMHNIRLTLDDNGEYQYYVSVPYREVGTNCRDMGGFYDTSTSRCKFQPPCNTQPVNWYGHIVCPIALGSTSGSIRVPDGVDLVIGYTSSGYWNSYNLAVWTSYRCYRYRYWYWLWYDPWYRYWYWGWYNPWYWNVSWYRTRYGWVLCSPSYIYYRNGRGYTFIYDYVARNAKGLTVSYSFSVTRRSWFWIMWRRAWGYSLIFGWEMTPKDMGPGYVKSMYEKIAYNYATTADVKTYAVSIKGDMQLLGYNTEPGYAFSFTVDKSRSDLSGYRLLPDYFTDKIISIKNNVFDIIRYTDEGIKDVGSLVIK